MSDMISRSALLERAFVPDDKKVYVPVVVTEDIKHAPAVDAVEVVREAGLTSCDLCVYGGKHLDAPPCTDCPAHPKKELRDEE